MEILPTVKRSLATTTTVQMPYATKLLGDELQTYMNMGIRILTGKYMSQFKEPSDMELPMGDQIREALEKPLPDIVLPETRVPEYRESVPEVADAKEEDLYAMGLVQLPGEVEDVEAAVAASAAPVMVLQPMPQPMLPQQPPLTQVQMPQMQMQMPQAQMPQMQMQMQMPQMPQMQMQMPQGQGQMQMPQGQGQMQMPQMPQAGGYYSAQMMQPTPIIYQSPIPGNAPPTIVIDTSPQAMQQAGYEANLQQQQGGSSFGQRGPTNRRHTTPRARASSPRGPFGPRGPSGPRGPTTIEGYSANAKVTIQKLG
jgi:hypothetical protein